LLRKLLKYLAYIFIGYLLIGFIALPLLVKPQLLKFINNELNAKVQITSLTFNPLIFELGVHGFSLQDVQKKELFSFETLRINLNPLALFTGTIKFQELSLIKPTVHLVYNKDKSINFAKIIKGSSTPHKKEKKENLYMPHIVINAIAIENGKLLYRDCTKEKVFNISLENIGFTLKEFDTKKITRKSATFRFYSSLSDGGFIDVKSKIVSLNPFQIKGNIGFEASKLYTEWKYMQDELKLEVADGKLSFSAQYFFNLDDLNATKIDNLHIVLDNLRIKPKNKNQDILNLDTMYITHATIFPMRQDVAIEKLGVYGLNIKAKRNENKVIDWLTYLQVHSAQKSVKKVKKSKPWNVILHKLSLEKIAFIFEDRAIFPNVNSEVDDLNLYANNITLDGQRALDYNMSLQVNKTTPCSMEGTLIHNKFDFSSQISCKNFDIVHYRPYIRKIATQNLQKYDASLNQGVLDFNANIKIFDKKSSFVTLVHNATVKLKKFRLSKRSTGERLVNFKNFNINNISLNTQTKDFNVSEIVLNNLNVNLARRKSGKLNVNSVVIAKVGKKIKKGVKKVQASKRPYRIKVKQFTLNNAKLSFTDKAISQTQKQILDRVYMKIQNIDSYKKSWLHYQASLRINKKGILKANGILRHTPLLQKGSIYAKDIPLVDLTPYIQESSYLSIDDGLLSFEFKERYSKSKRAPDLKMQGNLRLNSLFTSNSNDHGSSLLSLNELKVKPFTLELFPNRLYIDHVLLDSFYISAKIDENKTLNFAKLMKRSLVQADKKADIETTKITKLKEPILPITVVKVDVKNGSAEFEDFSLPIKFKTNIHDLGGVLYALSNTPGGTSYLDIDGEVDKYGSTKLKGSVDGFHPKEYTDLDFNFKNLDLHSMSGYSASFAGYEIDSGKLYLDLGYDIMYGKLHATNNIMIKHIKLGRQLEGKNIKHLPLGFVVGLLEDANGIIDIDMPIEGDVNQPDFKYGTLVWKTFGNLIAKAVSSPFKFLGKAMGVRGDELEYIAFEFAKSNITPPEREKLDKIAKMLQKRPKLTLEIAGSYDLFFDKEALKLQKLVSMVMKRSGDENSNGRTALTADVLEEIYIEMYGDDSLEKLQKWLGKKYKGSVYKRAYQKVLVKFCSDKQNVSIQELEVLAHKRAKSIQMYLTNEQGLKSSKIRIGKVLKVNKMNKKELRVKINIEVQSEDK